MKVKLKMDRKAIQEFFVQHVEKIIFAAVVACFALIVYRATAREMFPVGPNNQRATPDVLASSASQAKQHWEKTVPDPEDYKTPDYPTIADRSRIAIDVAPYDWPHPLDDPIFKVLAPRGVPPLHTVKDLRGTADSGQITMLVDVENTGASLPPGGGRTPRTYSNMQRASVVRGQRWVVLTGLVPVQEQFQAMHDYFKTAQKQSPDDVPIYLGYEVQRAEVSPTDAGRPVDWSQSRTFYSGAARRAARESWGGQTSYMSQDLVEPRFVNKAVGFPLPPLVDGKWDESVVHEPQIPLFSQVQAYPAGGVAPTEGEDIDDPLADGNPGGRYGVPGAHYGGAPAAQYGGVMGAEYDGPSAEFDGQSSAYAGARRGYSAPGRLNQGTKHYLFRFFDFDVESGKRYQYRVRLYLRNPNSRVEDRYLSNEVLAKKRSALEEAKKATAEGNARAAATAMRKWQNVESGWSEPSDVIAVPRDSRLLALSVQAPARASAGPTGKVMVISWVKDQGIEAYAERAVNRGKVANFRARFPETAKKSRAKKTARRTYGESDVAYQAPEVMGPGSGLEPDVKEAPMVDYLTDTLVLDLHGGQRLPGKDRLTRPGVMLLLDPDGNLVVRRELDDLVEYTEFKERPLPGQQPRGYEGGNEYDGEFDGYGGGNLGALRGGRSSYDGPTKRGPKRSPKSKSRRGS